MEWTEKHDVVLCREMLVVEPFKFKKGSVEKGKAWTGIAESLNSCIEIKFRVNQRSVRERFSLLEAKYKSKNSKDEKSSGISAEITELDVLIEEIIEKMKVAFENRGSEGSKQKIEVDRAKTEEARKKAMERVGQTKKRLGADGELVCEGKRKRRSGNDTVDYLREKTQQEKAMKERELELKKLEIEGQARMAEQSQSQMSDMMKLIQQQQQQGQAMQAMMLEQQQEQQKVFLYLIDKISKK